LLLLVSRLRFRHTIFSMSSPWEELHSFYKTYISNDYTGQKHLLTSTVVILKFSWMSAKNFFCRKKLLEDHRKFRHKASSPRHCRIWQTTGSFINQISDCYYVTAYQNHVDKQILQKSLFENMSSLSWSIMRCPLQDNDVIVWKLN